MIRCLLFISMTLGYATCLHAEGSWARHMAEGSAGYTENEFHRAIRAFERALEVAQGKEESGKARTYLGKAYGGLGGELFNAGELEQAEAKFRKSLSFEDNYFARFGLGFLYFQKTRDDEAFEQLQAAAVLHPAYHGTQKLLAILEYRRGRTDEALRRLQEAVSLDGQDAESRLLIKNWTTSQKFVKRFTARSSRHFSLRVDPTISASAARRVVSELEAAYGDLGERLGHWPRKKTVVVLYGDKIFHEATSSLHWVGGMYDGQLQMPVPRGDLTSAKDRAEVREVVRHEYAHVVVRQLAPGCPVWLNEGFAQYFEGPIDRDRLTRLLYEGRDKRLPLEQVPSRLWAVNDVDLARWTYLEGVGLVDHLVTTYGEFRLRLLLRSLAEENSLRRAFEVSYGRKLPQLENDWWDAVKERGAKPRS